MANEYLDLATAKTYIPPDILNSLTDDDGDGSADDDVIQRFIDDALPFLQGINSSLTDSDLLRIHSINYVLMKIYERFGITEKVKLYHSMIFDALRRTTGTSSQAVEESATPSVSEMSSDTFDSDEFELW